jgi:hypothetical protein
LVEELKKRADDAASPENERSRAGGNHPPEPLDALPLEAFDIQSVGAADAAMQIQLSQSDQQRYVLELCARVYRQIASRLRALLALSVTVVVATAATMDILEKLHVDVAALADRMVHLLH